MFTTSVPARNTWAAFLLTASARGLWKTTSQTATPVASVATPRASTVRIISSRRGSPDAGGVTTAGLAGTAMMGTTSSGDGQAVAGGYELTAHLVGRFADDEAE